MFSGWESHEICQVLGKLGIVYLSYNNFLFYGETSLNENPQFSQSCIINALLILTNVAKWLNLRWIWLPYWREYEHVSFPVACRWCYGCVDVFKLGSLSNIRILRQICELQQLPVLWWHIEIHPATTDKLFNNNSNAFKFSSVKIFRFIHSFIHWSPSQGRSLDCTDQIWSWSYLFSEWLPVGFRVWLQQDVL